MRSVLLTLSVVLFLYGCSGKKAKPTTEQEVNYAFGKLKWEGKWIVRDTSNVKYPCTIDSAIYVFFNTWGDSTTLKFRAIPDSDLASINHSMGMWLRNKYGLWSKTCLVEFFWSKGIFHPEDMGAILFTSYHRYLNAKPLNLEEQIQMYKDYWKNEVGIVLSNDNREQWDAIPSLWDYGVTVYKGNDTKKKTLDIFNSKKVKVREIKNHDGFIVHYNCDSVPFLKKQVGDTIKIWTEAYNMAEEITEFDKYLSDKDFGKTLYINDIMNDGRFTVSGMHETVFIFRNDSLFQFEENKPKLIFHPKMFSLCKKVKLKKAFNYMQDEIVLDTTWTQKGKKCYSIYINNVDTELNNEKTSYSFTFDENMKFLYWEDCEK